MHIPLINNDMKDSRQSSQGNDLTTTAFVVPVIAVLAILGGLLIGDSSALANQSAESTRINADLNESYFTNNASNDVDRLAQGRLEPRSGNQTDSTNTDNEDEEEEETANDDDEVSDEDNQQCNNPYLTDHLRIDFDNDQESVLKLQSFLKTYEGYDYVSLNGNFDEATLRAVKSFQTRYAEDILEPWGYQADEATGYVYITTKKKINEIYCDEQFLLSQSEQAEIREYRQKLNTWRAQGASFETPQYLANYYGYSASDQDTADHATVDQEPADDVSDEDTTDDGITVEETPSDEGTTSATTSTSTEGTDDRSFFERLFGIGGDDEATTTSTTTTATSTDDDDDRGFFERLFGIGGDDDSATTSTDTAEDDPEEAPQATTSTSTATSGLDNVAAGVYTGVNSIIDFLLSPTFLLIVLVILILLLVATLIETDNDDDVQGVDEAEVDSPDDEDTTPVEPEAEYEETKAWKSDADSKPVSEAETEEDATDVSEEDEDQSNEAASEDTSSSDRES